MATVLPPLKDPKTADDRLSRPSEQEVREQLGVLLASQQFLTSKRASEFLQFIVEHALIGDVDSLKERLLGIEIFHRRSDYDTSTDAIVRVTANDVRRRLSQFDQANSEERVRILLPPGSYVPDFIQRGEPSPAFEEIEVPAPIQIHEEPVPVPDMTPHPVAVVIPARVEGIPVAPSRISLRQRNVPAIWALSAVLVALPVGWLGESLIAPARADNAARDVRFYADLLGPIGAAGKSQTLIALSNPHVVLYRGSASPTPSKEDEIASIPVPADLSPQLNATANDTQGNYPFHYLAVDDKNYTGLGEAEAAFGLARVLEATGRSARLTQARFLNWDAAREQELVILGAPHMSAFAQSSLKATNFVMEHDAIRNQHPLPGELAIYNRSNEGNALEDYGLIWMGKSPSGSRVLVLAGVTSTGTAGVGQFFADPERMRKVYEQLKSLSKGSSFPETWQVLLRIDAREDVPVATTAIAVRVLDEH